MLSTATYDINGRVVSSVNVRESITTTISYDDSKSGTGQPRTVATTGQPTQFLWYDSAGNRTHQDEVPNFTSRNLMKWGYDALRRVVSEKMTLDRAPNGTLQPTPVSRSWTYAGPATTYVNRNGWTVTTTHKPSTGTRTETAYEPPATGSPAGTLGPVSEITTVQLNSDGSTRQAANRPAAGADTSNYTFTYDPLRRSDLVSGSFASLAGQSFSFDYDYDASGRLTQRKISSPFSSELFTTNYTFDAANRLDVISQSGPMAQPKGIDLVYGVFGQMDTPGRLGAGGRLIEAYRYNSATVPASPDSTVGSKTHYKYTPEGQVSDVIHRQGDETHIRTHAYWYTPQETLRIWFARSAADSW